MRERIYRTEAVILQRRDFGEADRLLDIATPDGRRRVVARGVRKTMSRIAGHIELFTHVTMLLAIGRNLDIVTQSQVIKPFAALHSDLGRLGYAYYIAELYNECSQEQEDNTYLFRLLIETLAALNTTCHADLVLRAYELRILHQAGYRPQLQRCPICHDLLTEEANRFSLTLGGVLCPRDAQADPYALSMSLSAFKLLRYLQRHTFDVIEQMTISSAVQTESERLLRSYIRHMLERDLKSPAFLETVRNTQTLPAPPEQ
jgi:DNA repair protein RecO (recombination protein O)